MPEKGQLEALLKSPFPYHVPRRLWLVKWPCGAMSDRNPALELGKDAQHLSFLIFIEVAFVCI